LEPLLKVNKEEIRQFNKTLDEASLVFQTTIFESFLNDITRIMIYGNLGKHLRGVSIDVGDLLGHTKDEIIERQVEQKLRNIAYQELVARIDLLKDAFSLKFDFSSDERKLAKETSKARNDVVHAALDWSITFDGMKKPVAVDFPSPDILDRKRMQDTVSLFD